ncbi:beta-lactamase family protein [bacterium]|nr:beta-lactamase family protein [bacterium]
MNINAIALWFVAFIAVACVGSTTSSKAYQDIIDKAVEQSVPGIQAYIRKGTDTWFGVAGLSSVEQGRPMTLNDRLRVASITKMMTYAVICELSKEGRLKLTDRVVGLLPKGTLDSIPYGSEITVAQLLDHKSGLHNFNGEDGDDFFADLFQDPERATRVWTAAQLLAYAKKPQHKAGGKPGEATSYSSTGYIVLELILEKIQGKSFAKIFRSRLFEPLEMKSAGVEGADFDTSQIADSYARPDNVPYPASPFAGRKAVRADELVNLCVGLQHYNAWGRAAGAVAATVSDLAKFMNAVVSGRLTVLHDQDAEFKRLKQMPNRYFDWNGGSWGIQATILYEPYRELTVIVLTNASNVRKGSHDIAKELLLAARL